MVRVRIRIPIRLSSLAFSFALGASALLGGCGESGAIGDPSTDGGIVADGGNASTDGGGNSNADGGGNSNPDGGGGSNYTETVICDKLADLSDLAAAYTNTPAGLRTALLGIADRRYPIGRLFIENQSDQQLGTWFIKKDTFKDILGGFDTAVHEGQHIWDIGHSGATWPYRLRDDLVITTKRLNNFFRNEILTEHVDPTHDNYANVYLAGQSGMQGFNTLLDEYSAYVHSLAARYCTRDSLAPGSRMSARDGILTMMYYVEVYLHLARTKHPADYAAILADPEHVRMILTTWDRAEFYLKRSEPFPELGYHDAMIRPWTYDPTHLSEIDLLRQK